jgi:phosphoserine phosphatase
MNCVLDEIAPTTRRLPPGLRLPAPQLIRFLQRRLHDAHHQHGAQAAMVFDADGTLWTRDAGEDLFEAAVQQNLLQEQALPMLLRIATEFSIDTTGTVSRLALRLYLAYKARRIPERRGAEMLIRCYSGWRATSWRAFAADTMRTVAIQNHYHRPTLELLEWGRRNQLRLLVISASPQAVIEAAVAPLGIDVAAVIAGRPMIHDDVIGSELLQPLPWGKSKATLGRAALVDTHWFAALGDSAFDLAMMLESAYAIAVRPKPQLRACLAQLTAGYGGSQHTRALVELLETDGN